MVNRRTVSGTIFDTFNHVLLFALMIITAYPVWYVIMASLSDPVLMYRGSKLLMWPRGFSLATYGIVFDYQPIWQGYANTLVYVIIGTVISMAFTICGAYGLSRTYLPGRVVMMFMIVFTMYFTGGMIPSFLVVRAVKLYDTIWAMMIPSAISTFNLIIMLTYFKTIPESLEEAAKIDGASEYRILFQIFLPLCAPVLAVISLYYAVAKWNTFFQALMYLRSRNLFPLQLILREILIQNDQTAISGSGSFDGQEAFAQNVKYAAIVVATIPILMVYPFIQKYFVKGVMIGAVKG